MYKYIYIYIYIFTNPSAGAGYDTRSMYVCVYEYIYIFWQHFFVKINFIKHHHHLVLVARISLTLSRHSSLSFIALGRSSGQHPISSHSCWMYVRAGRPAFARPCVGIHKSTSLMSSSLLLQQCPASVYIFSSGSVRIPVLLLSYS